MHIINPIYDSAFKYLMQNSLTARLLISAIIEEEVIQLSLDATELQVPVENPVSADSVFFTVLRIDFAARIRTAEGLEKEVLIEVQKAKLPTDIMRFRKYLGQKYLSEQTTCVKDGELKALPIITIYFLGQSLLHSTATVIKVNRQYTDHITKQPITTREDFIESLTHDSYVIQIGQLNRRRRNDLEALLSIFDQDAATSDHHILNINEDHIPEKYRPILRRLKEAIAEKKVRDAMNVEDQVINELQRRERTIEDQKIQLAENSRQLAATSEKLNETSEKLNETSEKLNETSEKLNETSEKLNETSERLNETSEKLNETSEKLNETSEKLNESQQKLADASQKLAAETKRAEEQRQRIVRLIIKLHHKGLSIEEISEELEINSSEIYDILFDRGLMN